MKKIAWTITILISCAALASCGGDGGNGGNGGNGGVAPVIKSISDLPRASGPVTNVTSASISQNVAKTATTGMVFENTNAASFDAGKSTAACDAFNQVKNSISTAALVDLYLCVADLAFSNTNFEMLGVNPYDGLWHIFNIDVIGDSYAPDKVKMHAFTNDAGSITIFEMFACKDNSQVAYILQNINGTTFAQESKGNLTTATGGGWADVVVGGTLNSESGFTARDLFLKNVGIWNGNRHWQESTLQQEPGIYDLSGYESGEWSDTGTSGTFADRMLSKGEIVDGNTSFSSSAYQVGKVAVGDGAALLILAGTENSTPYTLGPAQDAWYGDTRQSLANPDESPFISAVMGKPIPESKTSAITISFAAEESWDCTDDEGDVNTLPDLEASVITSACDRYILGFDWINCYQISKGS